MKKRAHHIKGISKDAESLNINRHHLRRVIIGERTSPKLLARYKALKEKQAAETIK